MKKILVVIISFSLFISCKDQSKKNEIKIACNLPMTGDLAFYGEEISSSIKMFMDERKDSMEAAKFNISYDFKDNAGLPKNAVSVYQSQSIEGFDIYMSGVTAQTAAIYDQIKATKKPNFVWSYMPFQLTDNGNDFRTWVDVAYEGQCFLKYIDSVKPKSVAFIYQNHSSTLEQFGKIIGPKIKEKGIPIVLDEAYDLDTKDFKNILIKVKNSKPGVIIIYGFKQQLIEIIKGLNQNKIKKDGNILCSFDFLDVQDVLDPKLLEGIVTNVPAYVLDTSNKINTWKNEFKKRYNRIPLFTDAYAYDCASIIYDASKRFFSIKNQNLKNMLQSTNISGLTGQLAFTKTGELKYNVKICKYLNGKFSVLPIQP